MRLFHQGDHRLYLSLRQQLDFPLHLQNAVELVYVTAGEATVILSGSRISLQRGDLLTVFPNQVHGFENSTATAYVMIIPVHPYLAGCRSAVEQQIPEHPVLHRALWAEQLFMEALAQWQTANSVLQQGYALTAMGKILSQLPLLPRTAENSEALERTLQFINNHYLEPLTRQQISQAVGYNESYLSHIFSDTLGTTLTDYIAGLRISQAAELLREKRYTVTQIAGLTGFSSLRTFNRVFRQFMSLSPTQYRNT